MCAHYTDSKCPCQLGKPFLKVYYPLDMPLLEILGIISGILAIIGHIPYIRDIILKRTKPERASWLIWSVLGGIAFFSQLAKGATNSLWLGLDTVGVIVTVILSIKYGMGGFAKRDLFSLIFASIGIVLWFFTKEPIAALIIVILVDFAGAILTITKSYEHPETETLSTFVLCSIAGFFAVLAVGELNFPLLLYPFYIGVINGITALAIILSPRLSRRPLV